MPTLSDVRTIVEKKVRDSKDVLLEADYDKCIQEAVDEYSNRKPYLDFASQAGTLNDYATLPSAWEENFSSIKNIEYPINYSPPCYLEDKDWKVEETDSGRVLRFIRGIVPGNDDDYFVRFTRRNTLNVSGTTIPDADIYAVANLAASKCCVELATFYTSTVDSQIDADTISYKTKGDEFTGRAKTFKSEFEKMVPKPSQGRTGEWDLSYYNGAGSMFKEGRSW